MRKLFSILVFVFILVSAPAHAWWLWVNGFPVQEGTQLDKLAADIHEVEEQLTMIKQHMAMLNSLKSRLLELGTGQIMEVFTEAQSVLQNAKSLTADISNFGASFKEHFPDDYNEIISAVIEGKRLADDWHKVEEGYMKTINMTVKNFKSEQQIRDKILATLNEADSESGQTKAIQIIGAIVNHASFLLDRNNQELSGFMESFITRQQSEKQRQQLAKKNVVEMGKNAAQTERTGKTFAPGFK